MKQLSTTKTNIPDDIWEEANEFQKTGAETHTDNQRIAAISGFIEGAMRERRRKDAARNEMIEQFERFLDKYFYLNPNQGRAWMSMKAKLKNDQQV